MLAVEVKWTQAQQAAAADARAAGADPRQTERMERLYDAGQTDLLKLLQVRRRFIEARNVELDAAWQADAGLCRSFGRNRRHAAAEIALNPQTPASHAWVSRPPHIRGRAARSPPAVRAGRNRASSR